MCEKIIGKAVEVSIYGHSSPEEWKETKEKLLEFLKSYNIQPKGLGGEFNKGEERKFSLIVTRDEAFKISEYLIAQGIMMAGSGLPN